MKATATRAACLSRTCPDQAKPDQEYCSVECALDDAYDTLASAPTWVFAASWADVPAGSRIDLTVGGERIVGSYISSEPVERLVAHTIVSDALGAVTVICDPEAMDRLLFETDDSGERARREGLALRRAS